MVRTSRQLKVIAICLEAKHPVTLSHMRMEQGVINDTSLLGELDILV